MALTHRMNASRPAALLERVAADIAEIMEELQAKNQSPIELLTMAAGLLIAAQHAVGPAAAAELEQWRRRVMAIADAVMEEDRPGQSIPNHRRGPEMRA